MPLDRFGSERADDDYARGDSYKEIFVETRSLKEFFSRDPAYRYILGTMGTGKSIMLLKMREHIEGSQPGAILAPSSGGRVFTPSSEFAGAVHWTAYWKVEKEGRQDITAWTQIWEWALLRCILIEWHKWEKGDESKHSKQIEALIETAESRSSDPYVSIADFLTSVSERAGPAGNPKLPVSRDMRIFVEGHANDFPPTYVFVDSQDDFFQESPQFWTASALGCKYAIDQVVRRSNHRIHIAMTLRPEMLSRTKSDADSLRFRGDIFQIQWTSDQVLDIFRKRASALRDDLLRRPEWREIDPFAAFFGPHFYSVVSGELRSEASIQNHAVAHDDPVTEPLGEYLTRHTLGRPREIILIGNQILETRNRSNGDDDQKIVREAVAQAAHTIALAYIGEIKQRWPWRQSLQESSGSSLQRFLRDYVQTNVLLASVLPQIENEFIDTCDCRDFEPECSPFSVLASAGLIGWPVLDKQNGRMIFQFFPNVGSPDTLEQRIPKTVKSILVHPVLYGAEFAIQAKKGLVVGPGVRTPLSVAERLKLI